MVRVREWGFMAVVMAIVVFTLNGWIGPKINPLVSLWLSDTPSLGENYFSWKSIFEAPLILSDLVGVRGSGGLRWGAGLVFWSSLAIFLGRRGVQKTNRFATLFFWSLPLFAFAVLPSSNPIQLFSTYYGHTAYLLLAIAASELLLLTYQKVLLRRIAAFLTVGLLFSQTTLAVPLYQNWVFDHLQGRRPEVWMKYARDYQEYLGPDALPVTWPEEGKEAVLASYRDEKGRYLNATIDGDGKFAHTAIAYLLR